MSASCEVRACARSVSTDTSGSAAARRSRARRAIPRYSSTCTGEILSHAAKVARWAGSKVPSRFATNHSAACPAMLRRVLSTAVIICSSQPRHAAPAMRQSLAQVFLDHMGRDPEPGRYFLIAHPTPIVQNDRGLTLRGQLPQHLTQPLRARFGVELATQCRPFGEQLGRVLDVDRARAALLLHSVFLR